MPQAFGNCLSEPMLADQPWVRSVERMEIPKSFITDEDGSIKSVVIDYATFQRIEEALLDKGLAQAMLEVEAEESVSLKDAKKELSA